MDVEGMSATPQTANTGGYEGGGDQNTSYDSSGGSDSGSSTGYSEGGNYYSDSISSPMADGRTMTLETDPQTGRKVLKFVNTNVQQATSGNPQNVVDKPADNADSYAKYATEGAQQVVAQNLAPYTLNEMSMAIANNNVDERRVPQEFQQQFTDFKLQQAIQLYNINQQAAIQQQQLQQQQVQQQMADEPAQRQARLNEFYNNLNTQARQLALAEMGMTEEDYENIDFSNAEDVAKLENFKTSLEVNRSRLVQHVATQAARDQQIRTEIENNYKEANQFIDNAKRTEPHYEEINQMMLTRYHDMPYKEAKKIDDATEAFKGGYATQKDLETIRNYYEASRKEFYAKQLNQQPAKPRYTEGSGYGKDTNRQGNSFDFGRFGSSNNKDQRAMLAKFLYGDR